MWRHSPSVHPSPHYCSRTAHSPPHAEDRTDGQAGSRNRGKQKKVSFKSRGILVLLRNFLFILLSKSLAEAVTHIWSSTWGQLCYKLAMQDERLTTVLTHLWANILSDLILLNSKQRGGNKEKPKNNTLTNTARKSNQCKVCVCDVWLSTSFKSKPAVRLEHWPSCLALLCLPWLHLVPDLPAIWTRIRTQNPLRGLQHINSLSWEQVQQTN